MSAAIPYTAERRSERLRLAFLEQRQSDPDEACREVCRAVIRQTLMDYQHMVARGLVSADSWLVLSDIGRVADQVERDGKYSRGRVMCGVSATMEDLRSALVLLGGEELDHLCDMASEGGHINITGDDCRRRCMRWHFDFWKGGAR